ncbi:MAG TPA: hypothetical protein VLU92_03130 [Candidatus Dormibacteraeota bacterium]|nr:hypothetical protein [Candidatus Dormibacteraeota bacterium]
MSSVGIAVGIGTVLAVSACGGGARQDATEPSGKFPVAVRAAGFPSSQTLAQHTHLLIAVRNIGRKTIPNVAVTICNVTCTYPAPKGAGTSAAAFSASLDQTGLANSSRPIWVVDHGPGACHYSCQNGGVGAGVSAASNTWALGALPPGRTVIFRWGVTAVSVGHHVVAWEVAAGLNGKAHAVLANGSVPRGFFAVGISGKPAQSYVNNNGQIVQSSGQ